MRFRVVLLCLILAGCSSYGNENIRNENSQSLESKLIKGKSTKADVRNLFGDPQFSDFTDSGNEQWKYMLSENTPNFAMFIPYVGGAAAMLTGYGTQQNKSAVFLFDKKGVLINYTSSNSQTQMGGIVQNAPRQ